MLRCEQPRAKILRSDNGMDEESIFADKEEEEEEEEEDDDDDDEEGEEE